MDAPAPGRSVAHLPTPIATPGGSVEPVRDWRLALLLARLADGWEGLDEAERARVLGLLESVLDYAGMAGGRRPAARRAVEWLGFRLIESGGGDAAVEAPPD